MLHIYYGFGRGKTSTLNGTALRTFGSGYKLKIYRFLKGRETSEDKILLSLNIPVIKIHQGTKFVIEMSDEEKTNLRKYVKEEMDKIIKEKDQYDFFFFDEIIDLVKVKMITEEELNNFLINFKNKEVLISGHYKYDKLFEMADLITFYEAEKHYFDKGIKARKGIEF